MEQGFHMMKQFREGAMGKSELTTGTQAIDRATALLSDVLQVVLQFFFKENL